jgi:hypothetical protein
VDEAEALMRKVMMCKTHLSSLLCFKIICWLSIGWPLLDCRLTF